MALKDQFIWQLGSERGSQEFSEDMVGWHNTTSVRICRMSARRTPSIEAVLTRSRLRGDKASAHRSTPRSDTGP
jgi:hypothetical protein